MSAILLGTILVRMATGQAGDPTDPSAENGATDVVIARVIDRRVDRDDADPDWDRRTFTYTLMIEAVEQGAFERNQEIQVGAFRTTWTGAELPRAQIPRSLVSTPQRQSHLPCRVGSRGRWKPHRTPRRSLTSRTRRCILQWRCR